MTKLDTNKVAFAVYATYADGEENKVVTVIDDDAWSASQSAKLQAITAMTHTNVVAVRIARTNDF